MEKKKEQFIVGEIVSHPIITFSNLHQGGETMGWVYKFRTTQFIGYEMKEVDINISSVYDMTKWDILKKGQKLQLSVIRKEKSNFSDDGFCLKCNITDRKFR